jgi:signal recognition particle subunit SRP54
MFENLSEKLEGAIRTLKGSNRITEVNVANTIKEIRRALLDADVNYKVAKDFTDSVKEKALGQKIQIAVEPGQMLVKIVYDELTQLMGGTKQDINLSGNPAIVLMAGLQGSGKTTFSAKLAHYLKKQNKRVLLVACDVYRPAAIEQLKTLGQQLDIEVYSEPENKNPVEIAQHAVEYAKQNKYQVVIVDTAGRLAVDEEMMDEISRLKKTLQPSETLFVVDAMTGQDAVNTAKAFYDRIQYDGVVLTKLDGDARGGAALSIRAVVDRPIKFIGTGEKVGDLDVFHPDRMASRILGMGDVVSLVERAQQIFDEKEAERINKKLRQNQFDFQDFYSQIQQIKKMGNIKDLLSMLPGVGKMVKDLDIDDDAFVPIEAIIQSMTPQERENPALLLTHRTAASRKQRIAKGSGRSVQEVNNLLKQFEQMQKMIKKMNQMEGGGGGRLRRMLKGNQKKKRR